MTAERIPVRFETQAGFLRGGTQSKVGWINAELQDALRGVFGEADSTATITEFIVDPTGIRAIWEMDGGQDHK